MKRIISTLIAVLAAAGCSSPPQSAPTAAPVRTTASAPAAGEVDCRAIQTTGPDSPAFGLLLLALEGSPDQEVAAAAHDVVVAHVGSFDDPAGADLVEIPLATLRIRCRLAYPGI